MHLLIVAFFLAWPSLSYSMTPEVFARQAESLCREHPDEALCKTLQTEAINPQEASVPAAEMDRATVITNDDKWRWLEVPHSAMDTVHNKDADEQWDYRGGAYNSWRAIQGAWSGGTVIGDRLYITGGGHGDGAHNGVFSVDINGRWERVTEPSPIWRADSCPGGVCKTEHGDCKQGWCTTGPDGAPVAIHSYNGLASDGKNFYRSGGSIWAHGNAGIGPRNFRLNLLTGKWSTFPDNGREGVLANLVHVDGKLYMMSRKGNGIYDIRTEAWEKPSGRHNISAEARMIYDKASDRFYVFGGGWAAWVERENFGSKWNHINREHSIVNDKYIGVVLHKGLFLFWNSGPELTSYDPVSDEWALIKPRGTPGDGVPTGPYGRFNVIDERIILINGVSKNMFWLISPGEEYTPPEPNPNISTTIMAAVGNNAVSSVSPENRVKPVKAAVGGLPAIEVLATPYYDKPQVDIVERNCGSLDEWEVRDLTTDEQVRAQRGFKTGDRVIFNVHWKDTIYPSLRIKGLSCGLVRGLPGPGGEKPHIRVVNMTHSAKNRPTRQGGLKIQNLYISMSEGREHFGDTTAGDCVGIPNSSQFVIFDNVDMVGCRHHSFITSRAYGMYLEIGNSTFQYAGSHLAYIDSVAMAYIHDSTFESPGWGHALRCIAGKCLIQNVQVSNINLDGTVRQAPNKNGILKDRIGMHPLEVYNCGAGHLVENTEINFYRQAGFGGSSMASNFRTRDAKWGCNLSYHTATEWVGQEYGTPEWFANTNWPERDLTYRNVQVNCLGNKPTGEHMQCHGLATWGAHPIGTDSYRGSLKSWLKVNKFSSWDKMLSALKTAELRYPNDWYQWTASRVFPGQRSAWLRGSFRNKWPVKPHPSWQKELAVVELDNVSISNGYGPFIRPHAYSTRFCWSVLSVDGSCPDKKMPAARLVGR